jgi:sphingomyelin phosphodiesterase 2
MSFSPVFRSAMRLRVLSLNCWGVAYVPVMYSEFRVERMHAVADHLAEADYDVVFLQEVWTESDRENIINRCRRKLPYNVQFYRSVCLIFSPNI